MNLDEVLHTFIAECRELLQEMEAGLLDAARTAVDAETVNAIFRAAHTIKGSAGLFSLDGIVAFTHRVETVLDLVREGRLELAGELTSLLLACCDHIATLVDAAEAGQSTASPELDSNGAPLQQQLQAHLDCVQGGSAAAPTTPSSAALTTSTSMAAAALGSGVDHWHLSLRFGPDVLRNGMDPLSFIRYLGRMGEVAQIVTLQDRLPPREEMDPESCYLGFEIALRTTADKATIEDAFEFVRDDCTLHLVPPHSSVESYLQRINEGPETPARLGDLLVQCGSITERELAGALAAQAAASGHTPRLGEILVAQQSVAPVVVQAALEKQHAARETREPREQREGKPRESQSVRVDSDKLDRLIDLVGELIIASAGAGLAAKRVSDLDLHEAHSTLAGLVQEVRDSALQLRMVKIGATFSRFQRVVHDVSRELGKDISLVIKGEDTELDKTVVEKIADPLTHLVRNAMDHGIGTPEQRRALGQPEHGTITLEAYHDAGSVVIEVRDDGQGLNRERILAKGIERGLITADQQLSDGEILNLIFEPGFSTAEKVTNLSGRGVGMDVVKRNITALRGTVSVGSQPGQGTAVTVRLPLTLAIIDGFQVGVGDSVFVVPLETVEECVEYRANVDDARDYTDLRGKVLPFIRLRDLFELGGVPSTRQNIVVLRNAGHKVGLVVDRLLGEAQTVIKPLSKMFAEVRGISGSSIRGTGEVALILDVPALIQQAGQAALRTSTTDQAAA